MAQYLDLNGLRTVVDNVKNIKSPVCLPIYNNSVALSTINSTIKNDTAPSYTSIVYNSSGRRFLAQYNNSTTYYTKWKANNTHMSSDNYGTATTSGVSPKAGYLYANSHTSTLQMSFVDSRLTNVANYVTNYAPSPTWTTITASTKTPFIRSEYIKSIQRSDTGNGTFLWKITVKNIDTESQRFDVLKNSSNELIQFGVDLEAGQEGTFTIELSQTVPNDYFDITF